MLNLIFNRHANNKTGLATNAPHGIYAHHKFQILTLVIVDDVTFSNAKHHLLHALRVALNYDVSNIRIGAVVSKQSHTLSESCTSLRADKVQSKKNAHQRLAPNAKQSSQISMLVTSRHNAECIFGMCTSSSSQRRPTCESSVRWLLFQGQRGVPLS